MRIAFDISAQSLPRSGVGQYQYQLLRHLLRIDRENEYLLYAFNVRNRQRFAALGLEAPNARIKVFSIPQRFIALSWLTVGAPALDTLMPRADLFHVSEIAIPPVRKAKAVGFVHDLTPLLFPQFHVGTNVFLQKRRFENLGRLDALLTNSEATKHDLVSRLGMAPERIFVTPLGADDSFKPLAPESVQPVLRRLGLRQPYLLFVGTLEPRKNLETLILAFNRLKEKYRLPHQLVLAGQKGWLCEPILAALETSPYRSEIVWTQYLEAGDLPPLMNGAEAFVYPSYYEGFGLPVLEAMQCGTPVVTSNVSALPEVGGDACLYADPHSAESLAERLFALVSNPSLRQTLSEKGIERAKTFSWERCARQTLSVYQHFQP